MELRTKKKSHTSWQRRERGRTGSAGLFPRWEGLAGSASTVFRRELAPARDGREEEKLCHRKKEQRRERASSSALRDEVA